jgi:hypothetical protein
MLLSKFEVKKDIPDEIRCVSYGIFSVARHYGGCIINGRNYVYLPEEDKLVWDQKLKKSKSRLKVKREKQKTKPQAEPQLPF